MNTGKQHGDKRHASSCNCAACAQKAAAATNQYPHWKERRQQRLGLGAAQSAPCDCAKCKAKREGEFEYGDTDFHTYWRRRRQLRHQWPLDVETD